jgi:hypothetical protein
VQTPGQGVPIENKEAIAKEAAERGKALQQITEQIEWDAAAIRAQIATMEQAAVPGHPLR